MIKKSTPKEFYIIGQSKSSYFFEYLKGTTVEKRKFDKSIAAIQLVSHESSTNFFLFPPKLQSTTTALLAYADIVGLQYFANTQIPLLRVFQADPTNRRITINFGSSLQFVPLRQHRLQQITLYLRNLYGAELKLTSYTRATLAVRSPEAI